MTVDDDDRMWCEMRTLGIMIPCEKRRNGGMIPGPIMPVRALVAEGPRIVPIRVRAKAGEVERLIA